ncbi:hypothetical protein PGT21_017073 [Puccinia graminis f. sp. tritici]|uniref:BED-type domain-containing protein n=1 Tax=Puccinia graminis f. sp. tritici TaxID=56615 RepID=A0A5B0MKE9_PUCGR|nr:hypothetical protein PGT21_017073 [Puccinia graminis f. sp. tritici]KAA1126901.1 hypothetical protein PGTUg99_030740 [Puccinia graminis f. sp. tritici]
MAGTSRKRCKPSKAPLSDSSIVDSSDEIEDSKATDQSKLQGQRSDKQELRRAREVHENQLSRCYASYNTPQLSKQLDKFKRKMIAYPCKLCGNNIKRPTYNSSTTNLSKHISSCSKKQNKQAATQKLDALGVSGTGDIDPREVPQLCAIWCAEGARSFSALGETAHQGIMHPTVLKNLPTRKAVSNNISAFYTAMQESFKKHKGALYLGLDAWQSPNGFDVLGTVVYRCGTPIVPGGRQDRFGNDFETYCETFTRISKSQVFRKIFRKSFENLPNGTAPSIRSHWTGLFGFWSPFGS